MNALYRVLALLVLVCALPAQATNLELQVVERTSGRPLPTYRHHGDIYVEGQAGQAFALDLINRSGQRVLAVTSIDGVNVVTGETAAFDQPGYVLDPGERLRLEGWRKNLTQVASFHFTTQHASYAGRTGRPGQVGVIGVAVFAEKAPPCCRPPPWRRGQASAAEPDKRAEAGASRDALASRPGGSTLGTGHGERHSSRALHIVRASLTASCDGDPSVLRQSCQSARARRHPAAPAPTATLAGALPGSRIRPRPVIGRAAGGIMGYACPTRPGAHLSRCRPGGSPYRGQPADGRTNRVRSVGRPALGRARRAGGGSVSAGDAARPTRRPACARADRGILRRAGWAGRLGLPVWRAGARQLRRLLGLWRQP